MAVLEINGLTKTYGKTKALNNLNLSIESGTIYGILGPNGSGKTTTLGIILGVLGQDSGTFQWFDGQHKNNYRKQIGAILETPNFYPYMTASENLDIVRHIKDLPKQNFDEILETVNLHERKKSKFRTYSLGMKQRLAIGATLIGAPKVVIFDEPTNGLDPEGIAEVRTILKNVAASGKTVLMASHILDEVEKVCTHVAIIKKGNLLATGSVGSILTSDMTIQINTANNDDLRNILSNIPQVKSVIAQENFLECTIDQTYDVSDFSKTIVEKGMVITHLVAKKSSLEDEFLQITKAN